MKQIILSLGAGIQSSCLYLMACRDEIERPDHVVFADTQCEPQIVYDHLEWLKAQGEKYGLPVKVTTAGSLKDDLIAGSINGDGTHYSTIPVFFDDGGMPRRRCSLDYKAGAIDKYIRYTVLGLKPRQRIPPDTIVESWIGITADEASRIRHSDNQRRVYQYPFCNFPRRFFDKDWKRDDCKQWLEHNYPERHVPKSACYMCPMRSDTGWRWLKKNDPDSFDKAVEFDVKIRSCNGMRAKPYLHKSLKPLSDVDFRTDVEHGQLTMFDMECSGYCGT